MSNDSLDSFRSAHGTEQASVTTFQPTLKDKETQTGMLVLYTQQTIT